MDDERTLDILPDGEQLTMERAARLAGYKSASTLRLAARAGRLQVTRLSERAVYTTAAQLRDYLSRQRSWGYKRGVSVKDEDRWQPGKPRTPQQQPQEPL